MRSKSLVPISSSKRLIVMLRLGWETPSCCEADVNEPVPITALNTSICLSLSFGFAINSALQYRNLYNFGL
ncbi:hypothetical protein MesoLjLc_33220 [Mesorhizobium sp. L-8-10]|nr:hypothetical protein MesoLjLb_34470 [Mesorhizobium sp. L-8-3]BCH31392.1 hypothetical protein MesoLjLc_33220 [Mesorhizobium sp. L-8-10]